jgi:hypothetical protein
MEIASAAGSPLMVVFEGGESRPYFRCQECGEPIKEALDALLEWKQQSPGEARTSEVRVLHKACAGWLPVTPWEQLSKVIGSLCLNSDYLPTFRSPAPTRRLPNRAPSR